MKISRFDVGKSIVDIVPSISKAKGEIDANVFISKVKAPSLNVQIGIEI
jgi:hypothetical protein